MKTMTARLLTLILMLSVITLILTNDPQTEYFRLKKAVQLDPTNAQLIFELGSASIMINHLDEAIDCYQRILNDYPDQNDTLYNMAYTLRMQGNDPAAINFYERVLTANPMHGSAHLGLAKAYLRTGNLLAGWREFEWRWQNPQAYIAEFGHQKLHPEDLANKQILLRAEWGLGDMMHFVRYAKLLHEYGAIVTVQTFKPLLKIFSLLPYVDSVVSIEDNLTPFDHQIPILSLPLIFKTELATIPAPIPYLFADQKLVEFWRAKLADDHNFKIGICWQAKPDIFLEEHPMTRRSAPLRLFAPLAALPNVSLYSLQQQHGLDQLNQLAGSFIVHTFDGDFDQSHGRYMDTAAVIENLDLIISVDTSVIHVAGAMGKPVWVMLPPTSEWRWFMDRTDTPWYPNMQLFRAHQPEEWASVIENIKIALTNYIASRKKS